MTGQEIDGIIDRWQRSAASGRANYQLFPVELCDVLSVPRPELVAPEQVAAHFVPARRDRVAEVLATLVSLGQARDRPQPLRSVSLA